MKISSRGRVHHVLLLAIVCSYLATYLATVSDYGITWDSANAEMLVGDRCYAFVRTGDLRHLAFLPNRLGFERRSDYPDLPSGYASLFRAHIWGFGVMLTSAGAELFYGALGWLDPVDAHHVVLGFLVAAQLVLLYAFALSEMGSSAALGATVFLATYPRYWAHAHNNPKDIVEAVLFTAVLVLGYRAIRRASVLGLLATAVTWGLALATKANAFFLPLVLAPVLALELLAMRRGAVPRWRLSVWSILFASPLLALAVMMLAWPVLLVDFPSVFLEHLAFLWERGGAGPFHFQWAPLLDATVTMPPPVLLLLLLGLVRIGREVRTDRARRSFDLLLLCWVLLPVLRVSVPSANDFDGIRHWIEFVPAACLVAGRGLQEVIAAATRWRPRLSHWTAGRWQGPAALAVALGLVSPTLAWQIRVHPNQNVYYNALVGGLGGAQRRGLRGATDYWGSSYRQGLGWLSRNAESAALLVVGVAEHIVLPVRHIWLRSDIEVRKLATLPALVASTSRRPLYFMYITRSSAYPRVMSTLPLASTLVHEISVDGGVILRIHKLH